MNPSDIRQAAIGLGMSVFTRYSGVVNSDDSRMTIREALEEISRITDVALDDALADMDPVTRWVVQWMEMHGTGLGPFHQAHMLAQGKGLAMDSASMKAVTISKRSKVRLLTVEEFLEHRPPAELPMSRYAMGRLLVVALGAGVESAAHVLSGYDRRDWAPIPVLAARIVRLSEPPTPSITPAQAHPWHALASEWSEIARIAQEDK